jgi:hypothetical protein
VIKLPGEVEQLDNLIGTMSLMLIIIFWIVQIQIYI